MIRLSKQEFREVWLAIREIGTAVQGMLAMVQELRGRVSGLECELEVMRGAHYFRSDALPAGTVRLAPVPDKDGGDAA